eukprot:1241299-Pleurochrysis_carterae.AAC.1
MDKVEALKEASAPKIKLLKAATPSAKKEAVKVPPCSQCLEGLTGSLFGPRLFALRDGKRWLRASFPSRPGRDVDTGTRCSSTLMKGGFSLCARDAFWYPMRPSKMSDISGLIPAVSVWGSWASHAHMSNECFSHRLFEFCDVVGVRRSLGSICSSQLDSRPSCCSWPQKKMSADVSFATGSSYDAYAVYLQSNE